MQERENLLRTSMITIVPLIGNFPFARYHSKLCIDMHPF